MADTTMGLLSVGNRDQDQDNKIAKLTALVVKLESEIEKITHSQEVSTTPSMTAGSETTPSMTAGSATTPSMTTGSATTTTTATTMGPFNGGVGDQALLLHIKDQDLKIEHQNTKFAELKALVEHQDTKFAKLEVLVEHQNTKIAEVNVLVEHQNTKFSEENAKFSEENAKFSAENAKFAKVETKIYKLETEMEKLTNSQAATTSSPSTTTSSPSTTTSSPSTTTSSPSTTTSSPLTTTSSPSTTTSSTQTTTSSTTTDTSSGVVFTRWGRSDCPTGISTSVYNGTVGGSHESLTGAAVNRLCMPNDPTWDVNKWYKPTSGYSGYVYSGSYYSLPDSSLTSQYAPCAVCRAASFSTKVMIPGRDTCYPGWIKAYNGELTSGYHGHIAATEYACLDKQPQKGVSGGSIAAFFYPVLAKCGLSYPDNALLTCVVCLK